MALALNDGDETVAVLTDLLDLVERRAGRDEAERAAVDALERLAPQGETEPIDGHDRQSLRADLEERAGVDRAALVRGDGEARLVDHGLERPLLDGDGILVVDLRQVGIVLGGEAGDLKARVAAAQADEELVVRGENDHVVRHLADDLAEQTRVEDDAPALADVGVEAGADTGLHVVAGDGQLLIALEQQALERRNGALRSHRPRRRVDGALQQRLFARKLQHLHHVPFF